MTFAPLFRASDLPRVENLGTRVLWFICRAVLHYYSTVVAWLEMFRFPQEPVANRWEERVRNSF